MSVNDKINVIDTALKLKRRRTVVQGILRIPSPVCFGLHRNIWQYAVSLIQVNPHMRLARPQSLTTINDLPKSLNKLQPRFLR
jgi:hypothetical protein